MPAPVPFTDPQLIDFCNKLLRTRADVLSKLGSELATIIGEYNARNLGNIITAGDASNLINDGSELDGRTRCTGGDVFNMITLLQDLETFLTQGRKDVINKWQVNGVR